MNINFLTARFSAPLGKSQTAKYLAAPLVALALVGSPYASAHQQALYIKAAQKQAEQDFVQLKKKIDSLSVQGLAATSLVSIKGSDLPWTDTGIELKKGQQVSFLLDGRIYFTQEHWFNAGFAFWAAVGDEKPVYTPQLNTGTYTAHQDGRLRVSRSAAEWVDQNGGLRTPVEHYVKAPGQIDALILVWDTDAKTGLDTLVDAGITNDLVQQELVRVVNKPSLPEGWNRLWMFGEAGIFKDVVTNAGVGIQAETAQDVGILMKDVDIALDDTSAVSWEWKIDHLPSKVGEDLVPTHDYLSIAVEFDDGQDLTYMWSAELEEGKVFRCPLPGWNAIETHYVIRSGTQDLGQWLSQTRQLKADYDAHIGGPATRIKRVWIIANSLFQRGYGKGTFRNLKVNNEAELVKVI